MKSSFAMLSLLLLSGCAANAYKPVPDGYAGATANIADSHNAISTSKVEFFYVEKIDGHAVENSRINSLAANRGRGMNMAPVMVQRNVPAAKPTSLDIVGRTEYAAPILSMTNTVYQVKGKIDFTPEPGKRYVVRGELGEARSAVWLEEEASRRLIGNKIEITGPASLGFFEK